MILMFSPRPILPAELSVLEEVKIGYTSPSISAFPIEFARRKGFFREEGAERVDDRHEDERDHERASDPRN
jgi:hypothetical protein